MFIITPVSQLYGDCFADEYERIYAQGMLFKLYFAFLLCCDKKSPKGLRDFKCGLQSCCEVETGSFGFVSVLNFKSESKSK